jgi:hypothetical protein
MRGKMLRVRLLLAGLIILVLGCVGRNPEYQPGYVVNEHFVGRFCLDPDNPHQDYIYMVPEGWWAINGEGRGVLPGLSPNEDWNYHGNNQFEEGTPRLKITIEGEGFQGREFEVWLLEDNNSIELRDLHSPWRTDQPLTRCP